MFIFNGKNLSHLIEMFIEAEHMNKHNIPNYAIGNCCNERLHNKQLLKMKTENLGVTFLNITEKKKLALWTIYVLKISG